MKKKNKIGIYVIITSIAMLTALQYLDAKFLNNLNPFNKTTTKQKTKGKNLADVFVGYWQVEIIDSINKETVRKLVSCDKSIAISSIKNNTIEISQIANPSIAFDLQEFNNRITWHPKQGNTSIAESKNTDEFWLYQTDHKGKTNWSKIFKYTKCKKTLATTKPVGK